MNQVLGNNHTSNPPLLIDMNEDDSLSPSPSSKETEMDNGEDTRDDSGASMSSGRKMKPKPQGKSELLIDTLLKKMELDEEEKEERKRQEMKREARFAETDQELISLLRIITTHIVQRQ
jgi:hypothetical protein